MVGQVGVNLRLLVFSTVLCIISGSHYVPVIIWQSNGGTPLPTVSAGDRLSEGEFQENVVDKINVDGPVFIFMQDSLSFEDFTLYGNARHASASENAFSNLEKIMDSYSSTVLPSVQSPSDAISALSKGRNVVEVNGDSETLSGEVRNKVIVFNLPTTEFGNDRQKALYKNDQIIGRVMKRAKDLFPSFVSLYTGVRSSWTNAGVENNRVLRHILSVSDNDANYTGVFKSFGDCFLLYGKNLTFKITTQLPTDNKAFNFTETSVPLDNLVVDTAQSLCSGNNSAVIVMNYASSGTAEWLQVLQLTLNFTRVRTDDWYLTVASLTYKTSTESSNGTIDLQTNSVWAPVGFSWNCGFATFMDMNRVYPRVSLEFNKLQLQAFKVNDTFGDSYDCVGFFTPGIWMSIFSSLILMMILAFGITMVMSINTNDRFDDPKGKTITVNATD